MRSKLCGLAFLLATLGFAQQPGQPPWTAPPYGTPPTFPKGRQMPPDQEAPAPQGLSTTQVEQQIQQDLNSEPMLRNTNLGVKADESAVVLTGRVTTEEQHDLALRIAQSYAGDRKVVDKIEVRQQT